MAQYTDTSKNDKKAVFGNRYTGIVRQKLRTELDRDEDSTVAIADSQSVKKTEKSAPPALRKPQRKDGASKALSTARDGGKKVKGCKRHIVVDSRGTAILKL
ncbi:hypothetical protein [Okeania sp. SIO2B3]|uniref:hypothetical protein n=1 Tax=Okeania sp. SIO2B3 TaxID=2607784 RepID=UPI0025F77E62|nr:hypothetical protein [Okeania sp. SIO2B3]